MICRLVGEKDQGRTECAKFKTRKLDDDEDRYGEEERVTRILGSSTNMPCYDIYVIISVQASQDSCGP